MGIMFTNNAECTLVAGLGAGDTSPGTLIELTAGDGALFPTVVDGSGNYFYVTLVDSSGNLEIIKITEHQDGTNFFQQYVRAQDDTTARNFAIGDKGQLRVPQVILAEYRDDIATNAADIVATDAAAVVLAARVAVNETDLAGTTNALSVPGPSGIKMFFYQDLAPAQWTIDSGPADSLLAVKGGSEAYDNVSGVRGSWTPTTHAHTGPSHTHTMNTHTHTGPSHTHTGPSHTHNGGGHVLTVAEMPSHTHGISSSSCESGNGDQQASAGTGILSTPTGGGNSHHHGSTSADGTGATGASGTAVTGATDPGDTNADGTGSTGVDSAPSTDRPKAATGIIATKD
jgi:hypothetical protein